MGMYVFVTQAKITNFALKSGQNVTNQMNVINRSGITL